MSALASGDIDVGVVSGGTLIFTPSNWSVPQRVLLAAARDADGDDDRATLRVSAANLTTENVHVDVTDESALQLVLSSLSARVHPGNGVLYRRSVLAGLASVMRRYLIRATF